MHSRKRWQAEQDQRRLKRMIREVVPEGPRMCIRGIQRDSNGARLSQQGLGVQKAAIIKLQMQQACLFTRAVEETEVLGSKAHTEGVVPRPAQNTRAKGAPFVPSTAMLLGFLV